MSNPTLSSIAFNVAAVEFAPQPAGGYDHHTAASTGQTSSRGRRQGRSRGGGEDVSHASTIPVTTETNTTESIPKSRHASRRKQGRGDKLAETAPVESPQGHGDSGNQTQTLESSHPRRKKRNPPKTQPPSADGENQAKSQSGVPNADVLPHAVTSDSVQTGDAAKATKKRGKTLRLKTEKAREDFNPQSCEKADVASDLGVKGKGNAAKEKNGGARKKWWKNIEADDPISLQPIARLHQEPFNLPADSTIAVWFDAKMLSNYLVASGTFVHPVSRRNLSREDCVALDEHCFTHHFKSSCVTEVFDERERLNDPGQRIIMLRQQATSIMEAFFQGNVRRRQDGPPTRQRNVAPSRNAAQQHAHGQALHHLPGNNRNRHDDMQYFPPMGGYGGIIDDDEDPYLPFDAISTGAPDREAGLPPDAVHWPSLGGTGYRPEPAHIQHPSFEKKERAITLMVPESEAAIVHVSNVHPKIKTQHLNNLVTPHAARVKWIDAHGALVMVRGIPYERLMHIVEINNTRKLTVVTLEEFQRAVETKSERGERADFRGKIGRATNIPGPGEVKFMITQMLTAMDKPDIDASMRPGKYAGSDSDDEDRDYQTWLKGRWGESQAKSNDNGAGEDQEVLAPVELTLNNAAKDAWEEPEFVVIKTCAAGAPTHTHQVTESAVAASESGSPAGPAKTEDSVVSETE